MSLWKTSNKPVHFSRDLFPLCLLSLSYRFARLSLPHAPPSTPC